MSQTDKKSISAHLGGHLRENGMLMALVAIVAFFLIVVRLVEGPRCSANIRRRAVERLIHNSRRSPTHRRSCDRVCTPRLPSGSRGVGFFSVD